MRLNDCRDNSLIVGGVSLLVIFLPFTSIPILIRDSVPDNSARLCSCSEGSSLVSYPYSGIVFAQRLQDLPPAFNAKWIPYYS